MNWKPLQRLLARPLGYGKVMRANLRLIRTGHELRAELLKRGNRIAALQVAAKMADDKWAERLADAEREGSVRGKQIADLTAELDDAVRHIGELTACMGEAKLAAVVEHEQTVAEHRRGSDPLLVSQDKPRPGVAVYPKWGRP